LEVDRPFDRPPAADDAYEIRVSFDPAWVQRVPRAVHDASVRRFWAGMRYVCGPDGASPCRAPGEPLDPFARANARAWPAWLDRSALAALATPAAVPALFGAPKDGGPIDGVFDDPYFEASAVVMDLRVPAYRRWRVRRLLYVLRDVGFAPGEPVCVQVAYRPGLHAFWDEA